MTTRFLAFAIFAMLLVAGGGQAFAARPLRGEARDARLDGHRVHYETHGVGREALVFVHGWTCNLKSWSLQVPLFAAKTRVIAIDLPGHGQSDKPDIAYTMDLFA